MQRYESCAQQYFISEQYNCRQPKSTALFWLSISYQRVFWTWTSLSSTRMKFLKILYPELLFLEERRCLKIRLFSLDLNDQDCEPWKTIALLQHMARHAPLLWYKLVARWIQLSSELIQLISPLPWCAPLATCHAVRSLHPWGCWKLSPPQGLGSGWSLDRRGLMLLGWSVLEEVTA